MDGNELRQKGIALFQKYRYGLLILLAGLFLMLLPAGTPEEEPDSAGTASELPATEPDFQTELSDILSQIHGAGQVRVFLSQATGEETLYQTDENSSQDTLRRETVVITGNDRSEYGLVRRVDPPAYLGAIVLCQGADDAGIRLAIVQAVSNATGLGTNQISVLKMK